MTEQKVINIMGYINQQVAIGNMSIDEYNQILESLCSEYPEFKEFTYE